MEEKGELTKDDLWEATVYSQVHDSEERRNEINKRTDDVNREKKRREANRENRLCGLETL